MKKYALVVILGLGITPAGFAFAGTGSTQLTTYYPAPSSNYQMIKLSHTFPAPNVSNACTGNPDGMLFADTSGTIYVCKGGTPSIYPQQCYNYFCTGNISPFSCSSDCTPTPGNLSCLPTTLPTGYAYLTTGGGTSSSVSNSDLVDSFQSSATTNVYSSVLCSY
ncbi:MAG: hypothetical protein KGK03_01495 [Candidatus Omnitrophica bacterium]|nr:hypothetical protein [Candidatus Omnitrophota bacterium]MDE2221724.1 hypothetical protein [Candidatus Omnitrophota bacterium]